MFQKITLKQQKFSMSDPVLIRQKLASVLNGSLYFAINGKSSAETILHFELCPLHLSSHITLSSNF